MILAAAVVAAVLARAPVPAPAVADHQATAPTRAEAPAGVESPELIGYRLTVADANLMGVTVTNYGFVGNDFVSRSPSMEYPLGTGYEHLVNGGLWIGAHSSDANGAFTGVTTACLDISQGIPNIATVTEFTPSGDAITVRSTRIGPHYDPAAVSELDLSSDFDDLRPTTTSGNAESHRPLGLRVHQENYAWSTGRLMHTLFFRYVIRSAGPTLSGMRVGLYTEFGSGQKNDYSVWPPSSSFGPGSWFGKAWLQYDYGLSLLREHYCAALPVPAGCNLGYVPYWVGLKLLTQLGAGQQWTLAAWPWSPGSPERAVDVQRYAIMSAGTIVDLTRPELMPQTGDPVEMFAIGPFPALAPGDSVVVGFALIGGSDIGDIQENANVAQRAWDSHFTDLPTPVQLSRASVEARPGRVTIVWQASEPATGCVVERRVSDQAWAEIARLAADGSGHMTLQDTDVSPGARYGYRALVDQGGTPTVMDEVWVDVPQAAGLSLEGWSPNPSPGTRPRVAFSLASGADAVLEVLDVGGRRIHVQDLAGLGPGRHEVTLGLARSMGPGVYFLRLTQDGRSVERRGLVLD